MEILIKDPVKIRQKEFQDKEQIDILALAVLNNFKLSQDDLKNLDVTFLQAVDFIQVFIFYKKEIFFIMIKRIY